MKSYGALLLGFVPGTSLVLSLILICIVGDLTY